MSKSKTNKAPLLHVTRRGNVTLKFAMPIRIVAIVVGLFLGALMCSILFEKNLFLFFSELFNGVLGTERRIFKFLKETALILGVGLALLPAFKMKFWNLGGNGQILMGCLASVACMKYFGGKVDDGVVNLLMVVSSMVVGAIWAVIPAIFKAFFNTNESLFTLMMNYIAAGIVAFCLNEWVKTGSGILPPIDVANLPVIGKSYWYLLPILVVAVLTAFIAVYMKHTKHGFEISIVGDNVNTAKYVGINVKKVVIRTMLLSGAICGIVGLLLGGSINHTLNTESANNMGFTAIMVAWLAKFNPLTMIATAGFISFVTCGMGQVQSAFGITNNSVTNIIIGLIYFCIIGCEFFIKYKVTTRSGKTIFQHVAAFFGKLMPRKNKDITKEEQQ